MLRNYFLVALRNIYRNKFFSAVNIFGLAIGLACCFMILLHVRDEFSYDKFNDKADQIYRLALHRYYPDTQVDYALSPQSLGYEMLQEMPEIKGMIRLLQGLGEIPVTYKDRTFNESRFMIADSNFFDFFSIHLLKGNPEKILRNPLELILTESTARKYFDDDDPIGKTLTTPQGELPVVGVCEDVPENSHFRFDFLAGLDEATFLGPPSFITFSVYTYFLIETPADTRAVEAKIPELLRLHAAGQIQARMGVSYDEYIAAGNGYEYFLQPLTSIHLHSHLNNELDTNGNFNYIIILISIALFILIIASINFVNLSTARSSERAKEVGIRKVVGSEKIKLIRQFMTESVLITLVSLVVALIIIEIGLPAFNNITGKHLRIEYLDSFTLPVLLGFAVIVGIISGSYPALVLSSFKPINILKGRFSASRTGLMTRKGLVIFQFFLSISLISFTLLIYRQLNYLQNKNLGFYKENILVLRSNLPPANREPFKQELLKIPGVISTATSNTQITGGFYFGFMVQAEEYGSDVITSRAMVADEDFIETMGLKLIEGRGFSRDFNDSLSVIINQLAAKEFGLEQPIGAKLIEPVDTGGGYVLREFTIIGIIEDFHYNSLHDDLNSFVLQSMSGPNGFGTFLYIGANSDNWTETIANIEAKWTEFFPQQPFSYFFHDEYINNMYQADQASGKIFTFFSLLAILIACVGLFGLASYSTHQRIHEIGIRKALGSSVSKIVYLFSTDFTKLVAGAFIVSVPVAILIMRYWLNNFVYRTNIHFLIFIISGITAVSIAIITISYHTIRSANTDPAKILRYE
jgi:putative ABC transport system permease protein